MNNNRTYRSLNQSPKKSRLELTKRLYMNIIKALQESYRKADQYDLPAP